MSANSVSKTEAEKEAEVEWDTRIPLVPLKIVFCQCGNKIPIFTTKRPLEIKCEKCGREGALSKKNELEMKEENEIGKLKRPSQKLVISTYENGLPRLRLLFSVVISCGISIAIFVYGGFTIVAIKDLPFSMELAMLFFSGSIIVAIIAIWNLVPESVEINDYGIKIKKGRKTKEAIWSEISEVKSKRIVYWVSWRVISITFAIVIKTKRWKHDIVKWRYSTEELKSVFISIAERVIPLRAVIEDELGWLPERLYHREKVYLGRMREYAALSKIGGFMILVGIILSAMIIFGGIYVVAGMILLFIGGMCVLCGVIGYFDEKKKMTTRKEPKPWIDLAIILAILLVMFAILFYMASLE